MLTLRGVSKSFGVDCALSPTDLEVARGETTVLIGPSGCGKSTLLRIVVGLERPTRGELRLGGDPIDPERSPDLRRRMGYVIQEGGLFPHLTAGRNASLMAEHLGWARRRIDARLEELRELTRLPEGALSRYPHELSGGQRQRVGLMRALMLDPELLLLDEPLGALDPMVRAELQEDLRAIFRRLEKTVLLVTHDMGEAVFFGHRIALLRAGAIVQEGTPRELLESPADEFVALFIRAQRSPLSDLERGASG